MRARGWVAVAAGAVLVTGYAAADLTDALPGILTLDEPWAEPDPFPTVVLDPAVAAPQILPDLRPDAPVPDAEQLTRRAVPLLSEPSLAPGVGAVVLDVLTGDVLLDASSGVPRTPASTLKLLTTTAALVTLGPQTRLPTRVVADPEAPDGADGPGAAATVYLVGGGDVLLAAGAGDPEAVVGRAGLGELAAATAAELTSRGVTAVQVALDDTAFSGPATAAGWGPVDLLFVSPVSPIAVDRGILPGRPGREDDPALAAARAFAAALAGEGLQVGDDVVRRQAPQDAGEVAAVSSATVADLVEHTLATSDNDVAETLARLVALATGGSGDFSGGSAAVLAQLAGEGLDVSNVRMADASGLSELNELPPLVLARLVAMTASAGRPDLLPIATSLPVAGLEGTLETRFEGADDPGAGTVRAKTGTLLTVVALAGTVLDADGRLLVFAVVADRVPVGSLAPARAAVDAWVSALAACGCS